MGESSREQRMLFAKPCCKVCQSTQAELKADPQDVYATEGARVTHSYWCDPCYAAAELRANV